MQVGEQWYSFENSTEEMNKKTETKVVEEEKRKNMQTIRRVDIQERSSTRICNRWAT